jgi:hypothetical protein
MTLHTSYPRVDMRFPHFAPALGALPLLNEPERTLEQALADAESANAPSSAIRPDPWPEVMVGSFTAAVSGAITGGVAAGSWAGAGIGAGLCSSAWSGFTLFSSYRDLGPRAKTVLGVSAGVGLVAVAAGLWARHRRT